MLRPKCRQTSGNSASCEARFLLGYVPLAKFCRRPCFEIGDLSCQPHWICVASALPEMLSMFVTISHIMAEPMEEIVFEMHAPMSEIKVSDEMHAKDMAEFTGARVES